MLRIGILGAARITPAALIHPARITPGVAVTAVAARAPARAARFATQYHIPTVHDTYAGVINDPQVDAVYNPLPNSLHHEWTLRALAAGKDVLCEKPMASNAVEAQEMVDAASRAGLILMEAFHYRYHPLAMRVRRMLQSGAIGRLRSMEIYACTTLRRRHDIRLDYALGCGALMDMGCYAVHFARFLAGAEPAVRVAKAEVGPPSVDVRMEAGLLFPPGVTARLICSFHTRTVVRIQAILHGDQGQLRVTNFMLPHYFNLLEIRGQGRRRWMHVPGQSTYTYQLAAFADAVSSRIPPVTGGHGAVANMRVIDAIYAAAGLPIREQPHAVAGKPTVRTNP